MNQPAFSSDQAIDRLSNYSELLCRRGFDRARPLWDIWLSFNSLDNPLRGISLTPSRAAPVLNSLAEAARNETMIIITRAFDRPGRNVARSNRVSYPVLEALTTIERVLDVIEDGHLDDGDRILASNRMNAIAELSIILARLEAEQPNRIERLRSFRDEYLAHNLVFDTDRETPLYGDVSTMLDELELLSTVSERAFKPHGVKWQRQVPEMSSRAPELWKLIYQGATVK